jgi:hypothetical protein
LEGIIWSGFVDIRATHRDNIIILCFSGYEIDKANKDKEKDGVERGHGVSVSL